VLNLHPLPMIVGVVLLVCACARRDDPERDARLAALADSLGARGPYHACGSDPLEEGCRTEVVNGEVAVFTASDDRLLSVRRTWQFSDSMRWAATRDSLVQLITRSGAPAVACGSPDISKYAGMTYAALWRKGWSFVILSAAQDPNEYVLHYQVQPSTTASGECGDSGRSAA
jgi:hypothetical protein